jgi:hypothetical protein
LSLPRENIRHAADCRSAGAITAAIRCKVVDIRSLIDPLFRTVQCQQPTLLITAAARSTARGGSPLNRMLNTAGTG